MQCQGTTQKGTQCQLTATGGNGFCQHHSDNGSSRQPAKHKSRCTVCAHPQRAKIEQQYVDWGRSLADLASKYGLSRSALNRHMAYMKLRAQRATNILGYCERIMERAMAAEEISPGDGLRAASIALKAIDTREKHFEKLVEFERQRAFEAFQAANLTSEQLEALREELDVNPPEDECPEDDRW